MILFLADRNILVDDPKDLGAGVAELPPVHAAVGGGDADVGDPSLVVRQDKEGP